MLSDEVRRCRNGRQRFGESAANQNDWWHSAKMAFVQIIQIIEFGAYLAGMAAAVASLIFFLWAFLGRQDWRNHRLRAALSSFQIMIAGFGFGFSLLKFVVIPSEMVIWHPEYRPQYEAWHKILCFGTSVAIVAAAGLAVWSLLGKPVNRKRVLLLALGCISLIVGLSAANWMLIYSIQVPAYLRYIMIENRDWMTRIGDTAPDIEYSLLDGSHVHLSELRGKVVLVNFFATWCGPCLTELPHVQELWQEFAENDGFRLVVIGRQETQESVADFKTKRSYTFPMATDHDASAFGMFAKDGIPRTYLIARDGTILFQSIGFAEIDVYQRELSTLRHGIQSALDQ
jgi:peroxiredoxin